jgi:hypothetical protein
MSPKAMTKTAQQNAKPSTKKAKELTDETDVEKKEAQMKASDENESSETETPMIDPDELEEQEDAASAEASNGSSNAAALAAATSGSTEMSASFKNFRHHPDMENFYRFIYENDLRHEALAIIDEIMAEKVQRKLVKGSKAQAH